VYDAVQTVQVEAVLFFAILVMICHDYSASQLISTVLLKLLTAKLINLSYFTA
jgi:hypothetical protein